VHVVAVLIQPARASAADLGELASRANAGDLTARRELLVELYRAVRKHVHLVAGGGSIGEDIVQETMIAVHRGLAGFRGDASPRTWALAIATRTAYRLRRKEARYVLLDDDAPGLACYDHASGDAAELVLLQRALATLAPKKRDAFVLMAIFELSAQEAGKALGTFANTAASRYRHARAELDAYLARTKFDEPGRVPRTEPGGDD
jgi:RNA polymerase sigma-70 factor (ECF subfamily)